MLNALTEFTVAVGLHISFTELQVLNFVHGSLYTWRWLINISERLLNLLHTPPDFRKVTSSRLSFLI